MDGTVRVAAFFYGSYMDPEVLGKFGAEPGTGTPATLTGWRLTFSPHANLVEDAAAEAEGFLYELPHDQLDRLYGPQGFVTTYRPVPVIVETPAGERPAMTYVEPAALQAPEDGYLASYLAICRRMGLPEAYVARVEAEARRLAPAVA